MFEPTPELVQYINSWGHTYSNLILIPSAVSCVDSESVAFNIAGHHDWGCSSLLKFSDDHIKKAWGDREDLYFTDSIDVSTIRLDSYISAFNKNNPSPIVEIDYLHIDTQGSDLEVIKSLGDYLPIVKAGQLEVPDSENVALYQGQHTEAEAIYFLYENGFRIVTVLQQQNERNLVFEKGIE